MSEEPSPASTSSTSGKNSDASSPLSNKSGREPRLVLSKQPPTHVYPDEWFDIEVGLDALRGSPTIAAADLKATLHNFESGQLFSDPGMLTVNPEAIHLSTLSTPSKRYQTVKCRINVTDLQKDEPIAFVIRISPKNGGDSHRALQPVTTRPIRVVRLKLEIKEKEGWESVWYKDEGGRDKCMTVTVGTYDSDKALTIGEKIPLQLTLCYDNSDGPIKVSKQEIFRMIGSTRNYIDKKSGTATLRFRIEDVSKNHQGQDFCVEVAVDPKATGFKNIAPTYTPNVSIRSKRNKRQRSVGAAGRPEAKGPSPMGGGRPPYPSHGRSASYPGDEHEASFSGSDVSRLREAMKGVISWTDDVVNGLYPLQWQIIGYAQNPDGTPDYNRPYHSMPNPNATISRVLATYSESTRENLRVLLTAVEKSSPGSQVDAPFLPPGVGMAGDRFGAVEGMPQMIPPAMDQRMASPYVATAAYQATAAVTEGFRDKRDTDLSYGGQAGMEMGQPQHIYQQAATRTIAQDASLPAHVRQGKSAGLEREQQRMQPIPVHDTARHPFEDESRESEVEYVLAKQFKALRTGERLGFPAYSARKELLGFYHESSTKVGVGQFVPLSAHRDEFGYQEKLEATKILEDAISSKSEACHSLKEWGSISSLLDHALVYDWTKEIGGNNNAS